MPQHLLANATGIRSPPLPCSSPRCASPRFRRSGVVIGHAGCPRLSRLRCRCACRRRDTRRLASAPGSRSRGRAGTVVDADLAPGPDEEERRRRATASLRCGSPDAAVVASQPARIVTALSSAASAQRSCQAWLLLLVQVISPDRGRRGGRNAEKSSATAAAARRPLCLAERQCRPRGLVQRPVRFRTRPWVADS